MLSAGKVLSQPVDRKSTDPSSDFEDDDEDEETRVLDTRELGFARESRRVDPSLKSALRSSFVPPPPTPLGSRPSTLGPGSRLSAPPPMSVPSVRAPAAMPPPSGPPSAFPPGSRRPPLPPAAPAPSGAPPAVSMPPALSAPAISAPPPVVSASHAPASATTPRSRVPVYALLAAVLAAVGTWLLFTGKGDLLITVAGADNAPVSGVQVYIDGTLRCSNTPCKVEGLKAGSYTVRAEAPGHVASADQAVNVEGGASAAHHVQLKPERTQPQLTITAQGAGLRVLVDGKDRGAPPVELSTLAPGEHTIRVEGAGYEAVEQTIVVQEGVAQVVGPLSPTLLKGSLRLALGENADGASVFVNGKSVRSFPATLELDAQASHRVLVRKAGYADLEQTVSFSDEQPRIDLDISLTRTEDGESANVASPPTPRAEPPAARPAGATEEAKAEAPTSDAKSATDDKPAFLNAMKGTSPSKKEAPAPATEPKTASAKAASGTGTLNINSVPPTTVLLNGRPLGKTPKAGISVPAGSHTITFIHTDKGRKTVKVSVEGGGSKTVSVRL